MHKAQIGHDKSIIPHNQVEFTLTPAKCTFEFRLFVMSGNMPSEDLKPSDSQLL